MAHAHLSLRSFLLLIALLAAGLALIAAQSRLAANLAISLFWIALFLTIAGALVARGPVRAFCIGTSVFGVGYWLLAFENEPSHYGTTAHQRAIRYAILTNGPNPYDIDQTNRFSTSDLIDLIEDAVRPRLAVGAAVNARYNGGSYYTGKVQTFDGSNYTVKWDDGSLPSPVPPAGIRGHSAHIRTSAHAVLGLALALLGGMATVILFARPTDPHPPVSSMG